MSKTRIAITLFGVIQKIRKSTAFHLGLFLSLCRESASATVRVATAMLLMALLVSTPVAMSAATPDAVLQWIGLMNTAVLADGSTSPLATTRVVALVSSSVFDTVNGIEPRLQPLHVKPDAPHHASQRAAANSGCVRDPASPVSEAKWDAYRTAQRLAYGTRLK
jgi:hypothetical protein